MERSMTDDYEDMFDIEDQDDGELRDLVFQELREAGGLDLDLIDVDVRDGRVCVSGRVGTEQEWQQIEQVLTDVLRVENVSNEIVIDELVRGERSEAADDEVAEEFEADPPLGRGARRTEDSAAHLMPDTASELYGTRDPQQAAGDASAWTPPDRPIQEGTWSQEEH
jgi:hypothetical protein